MSETRIVRVRPGLRREPTQNVGTVMAMRPVLDVQAPRAKELFISRYRAIRASLSRYRKQGVLFLVFDEREEAAGEVWLEASLDKTRAAICGRHSMCELLVPSEHASVSLRHLALLARAKTHDEVRIRVIDLRTGSAFVDESNRMLQSVVSDGPMFLKVEDVDLIALLTPEIGGVIDDPEAAYAALPQRVFFEEHEGPPEVRPRGRLLRGIKPSTSQTIVRAKGGAVFAGRDLLGDDEAPVGSLTVRAGGRAVRYDLGANALDRGVLVGRYARCDLGTSEDDSALSRVHLLMVREGGRVLAIDTASTNGTTIGGRERRVAELEDGTTAILGGELEVIYGAS